MSKCDLRIELDRTPPHYRPGEVLKGKVAVWVNEACACDALTVELRWRTHGAGNQDQGPPQVEHLGAFRWNPQASEEIPFQFTMPDGPVSYHGYLVNVDWYLTVRADIPWAIDPRAERDLLLLPAPVHAESSGGYRDGPRRVARRHDLGPGSRKQPAWLRWVVFIALPLFVLTFFRESFVEGDGINWFFVLPLVAYFGFAGRFLWKDIRNAAATQQIGALALSTEPSTPTRGESVTVRAVLVPKSSGVINGVGARLVGEETAVSGSGTDETTHRHVLGTIEAKMAGAVTFSAGERREFTAALRLPADGAPTFRSRDNAVRWVVSVAVDIKGWPDLEDSVEIEVHPS